MEWNGTGMEWIVMERSSAERGAWRHSIEKDHRHVSIGPWIAATRGCDGMERRGKTQSEVWNGMEWNGMEWNVERSKR